MNVFVVILTSSVSWPMGHAVSIKIEILCAEEFC